MLEPALPPAQDSQQRYRHHHCITQQPMCRNMTAVSWNAATTEYSTYRPPHQQFEPAADKGGACGPRRPIARPTPRAYSLTQMRSTPAIPPRTNALARPLPGIGAFPQTRLHATDTAPRLQSIASALRNLSGGTSETPHCEHQTYQVRYLSRLRLATRDGPLTTPIPTTAIQQTRKPPGRIDERGTRHETRQDKRLQYGKEEKRQRDGTVGPRSGGNTPLPSRLEGLLLAPVRQGVLRALSLLHVTLRAFLRAMQAGHQGRERGWGP